MDLAAFLARSPDAALVRGHIAAAVSALSMAQQCLQRPEPPASTTADLHRHLAATLWEVEAAKALVPRH